MRFLLDRLSSRHLLYLLYLASGGIYVTSKVSKWIKYFVFACSMIGVFMVYTLAAEPLISKKSLLSRKSFIDFTVLLAPFLYILVFIPAVTSMHSNTIEELFAYITAEQNTTYAKIVSFRRLGFDIPSQKSVRAALRWFFLGLAVYLPATLFCPINGIFQQDDENFFRDVRFHIWPISLIVGWIPSIQVYLVVYAFEILLSVFVMILFYSPTIFFVMLFMELHDITVYYCLQIQDVTNFIHHQANSSTALLHNRRIILLVKRHQEFRK